MMIIIIMMMMMMLERQSHMGMRRTSWTVH